MACSSCSGASGCNCALQAGTNITVSGTGTQGNPWVVSANLPPETPFTGVEGPGITITPGGIIGHSPIIGICLSTDFGNAATFGTDNCLYVPEIDFNGQEGPYITIVPGGVLGHSPTIGVHVSTDAGNQVFTGGDGGLYVPAAPIIPLNCEDVQDCVAAMLNTVGFQYNDGANRWDAQAAAAGTVLTNNGAGGAAWAPPAGGTNFTIQAVPTGDCGASANGGVATVLTGENIQFRAFRGLGINVADGGAQNFVDLFLPGVATSLAAIGYGCADGAGAQIYCGAGGLRTVPDSTSRRFGRQPGAGTPLVLVNPGAFALTSSTVRTVVNPSTCRSANYLAHAEYGFRGDDGPPSGTSWRSLVRLTENGGGLTPFIGIGSFSGLGMPANGFGLESQGNTGDVAPLGPSGAFNYVVTSDVFNQGGQAGMASTSVILSILLVTQ